MDPIMDVDKLTCKIFSILESKFLFGYDDPTPNLAGIPPISATGSKISILSLDAGGGPLADAVLARLESSLRVLSGDPSARVVDFFDLAAASGAAAALAFNLLAPRSRRKSGALRRLFRRSGEEFGDLTLRDLSKPVLVPCFDLATGAPLVFSRADAVESDGCDFLVTDVCAATCADRRAVEVRSVDGSRRIRAVGGAAAMRNPTAAAITHVLNNRWEFPHVRGVDDLMVLSVGGGEGAPPSRAELARIAGEGMADMVDQAVAMAFGHNRITDYVRIEANGLSSKTAKGTTAEQVAEVILGELNVESLLFRGKKISEQTNIEKIDGFASKLIKELERRKMSSIPTILNKQAMSPRSSSGTTATLSTSIAESWMTSSSL